MKTGLVFTNAGSEFRVLAFTESKQENLALLIRHDGMFVTARNISEQRKGSYTWAFGHYFTDIQNAVTDFDERTKILY